MSDAGGMVAKEPLWIDPRGRGARGPIKIPLFIVYLQFANCGFSSN